MASRILLGGARSISATTAPLRAITRSFHATPRSLADATATATPLPARKPVGAFRGGLFGFLLGSTLAGAGVYSYVLLVDSQRPRWVTALILSYPCALAVSELTTSGARIWTKDILYGEREYKASNELLTEDIYALQAACQRLNTYVQQLEEKMDAAERKKK
ncbi:hypothetical protein F5Y02DRAFT_416744 [Annulohypoxylon stygium]|nr:hypothetical protein F5Y02DRAFT_416744 [Annulohypoxylon stygium]